MRRNRSTSNWVAEGPHILKRGAWYYLLTAEGGTEVAHQEWVSRSRSPLGPWETPNAGQDDDVTAPDAYLRKGSPSTNPPPVGPGKDRHINPLIYNGDDPHVQMTGHMDMAEAPDGRWWAFCLAVRPQDGRLSQLGRETFLMPVEWVDDWPVINSGKKVAVDGDAGCGLERVSATEKWEYSFNPNMSECAVTDNGGDSTPSGRTCPAEPADTRPNRRRMVQPAHPAKALRVTHIPPGRPSNPGRPIRAGRGRKRDHALEETDSFHRALGG